VWGPGVVRGGVGVCWVGAKGWPVRRVWVTFVSSIAVSVGLWCRKQSAATISTRYGGVVCADSL
jgi:hypothetical protein